MISGGTEVKQSTKTLKQQNLTMIPYKKLQNLSIYKFYSYR